LRWGSPTRTKPVPFLFIVLVIIGAYYLLTSRSETAAGEKAVAILDERYAKGEMTKEQYVEMKQQLTKK
jgi:uncharacterized membrane protein